ncbi:MAG: hypothetical protein A3A86_07710 [Elusimicrobia bacterium RIFCSPLOWO2_01_FULL_60_11]|nr:MAG: hypothetical protein A3A86_07710 [Elusimicrobia bacterium RIFCSPLOWO2_01_FULL_60_11]
MPAAADPRTKTILVVDDDVTILDLFELSLVRQGFNAMRLPSGEKAIQIATRKGSMVDLIILDLMLPGKDGSEVLKELQNRGASSIPIFVVTAKAVTPEDIRKIKAEPNVKAFFQKPVDVKDLSAKVHEVLGTAPIRRSS